MTGTILTCIRPYSGDVALSAMVHDGMAPGAYRRERVYQGYTIPEAHELFRAELEADGGRFDGEGGH
jgi:hypothetical protein